VCLRHLSKFQLVPLYNGVGDCLSFSDNEHGHLMMSRGTQEHVDCTESNKLSREVNMNALVYSETNKAQNELNSCFLIQILFVKRNHSALVVNYSIFSLQLKVEIMTVSCYIRSVCDNPVGKYNML
jgi:hypothetical protein